MKHNSNLMEGVKLDPIQLAAIDAVLSGDNTFITGPAGSGKSTIITAIKQRYPNIPVTSSTGISACLIGGTTIHSFSGLKTGKDPANTIARNIVHGDNDRWRKNIRDNNKLIIDECSMLSYMFFNKLDVVLRLVREEGKHLPFGGMQIILFGDLLQIPPIKDKDDSTGASGKMLIESQAYKTGNFKEFYLPKIYRQADPEFGGVLSELRLGVISEKGVDLLSARVKPMHEIPEGTMPTIIHPRNKFVDDYNYKKLQELHTPTRMFEAVDETFCNASDKEDVLKELDKGCMAPKKLYLKVGARVMLLSNLDLDTGLANGALGTVVGFRTIHSDKGLENGVQVIFDNGITRTITVHEFKQDEGGEPIASRTQLPLKLAWACTTHKSQGATLDNIAVYAAECWDPGQVYVALSRVKTKEGLFIQSFDADKVFAHTKALDFYNELLTKQSNDKSG